MEALWKTSHDYQHLCYMTLGNHSLHDMWVLLARVVASVKLEHGRAAGCEVWSHEMSLKTNTGYLADVLASLVDTDSLTGAGLLTSGSSGMGYQHSDEAAAKVAQVVWAFVLSRIPSEVVWVRRYSHAPPGRFFALLRDSTREEALHELQAWWAILNEAERLAFHDDNTRGALSAMLWGKARWNREVFVGLDECQFEFVPADLREEIAQGSRAIGATKVAEDAFNVLGDKTGHAKSGAMGRRRRYHTLLTAMLLDDCGRGAGEQPLQPGALGTWVHRHAHIVREARCEPLLVGRGLL